ncbi:hypothetical protein BABINDRAFT_37121 [Babjeviella inositovora NRRL Y-12698]|uniref:Aminotransferase class I/classII large domain-containing protein n=1 Tax=Babjeviella inositovora NRRL Y-12698 TaxID=984486 RepID=A0A1E3QPS9_9ASCO|nr:uncharacterized protein BABINDRAFT_37121 [Babjeviella inositovora NRRL Y-12698]ODQ79648.1 hypothetical protein BABINDRAFT_37121 [Babjeviella inositovora NRRL Y-12698]
MSLPKHNQYFQLGGKDIWSLINETAAASEKASGTPVVNLGQGFFSYSPPDFAIEGANTALASAAANQYSPTRGRSSLLQALAATYSPRYGKQLDPNRDILVTTGANEGMLSAFFGFVEPGDEVIVFEPFFDQYISNIEIPGGKVVYVQLHPPANFDRETISGKDWKIDFAELEAAISPKTKMIVVNTPHNPVGKVFTREELLRIGELAVKHNFVILSDEVYENLYYTPEFTRIATLSPEIARLTLTVGSAGKSFAATGWRIGWLIGNPDLLAYASMAHTRICFSSPSPLQEAVATAITASLKNDYYATTKAQYVAKYEILNAVWEELGLPYTKAEGGYFTLVNFKKVFANIPADYAYPAEFASKPRDFKLAYWLIKEFGVVAIPPSEFYIEEHKSVIEDCLRFAVCKDDSMLEEAVKRLRGLSKYL